MEIHSANAPDKTPERSNRNTTLHQADNSIKTDCPLIDKENSKTLANFEKSSNNETSLSDKSFKLNKIPVNKSNNGVDGYHSICEKCNQETSKMIGILGMD